MASTIFDAQSQGRIAGLASAVSNGQPVPQRLEIDDLVKNHPDAFNLYVLALESIQKDKYKEMTPAAMQDKKQGKGQDRMSYFEIAGIHGLPNRPWDNVESKTMYADDGEIGYCTHGSILFPTWHRPYLAMMEQTIFNTMGEIAKQFKDPKYVEAARTFRLPYWDYFQPRLRENDQINFGLPRILKEKEVKVYRPEAEGKLVPVSNPLKSFTFPGTAGMTDDDWTAKIDGDSVLDESLYSRTHTVRHASSKNRDEDNWKELDDALEKARKDRLQQMLDLLILLPDYRVYRNFASSKFSSGPNGSLESFHGDYHTYVGGGRGHMSEIEVAAFDPVFWLHHCNIDRIFAIWQRLHNDFVTNTGDSKNRANTPLYPFRLPEKQKEREFWDSDASRQLEKFGYTYPDLVLPAGGKKSVRDLLIEKYSWGIEAQSVDKPTKFPETLQPISVKEAQAFRKASSESGRPSQAVKGVRRRMMEEQVVGNPGAALGPGQGSSFDRGDEILRDEPDGSSLMLQWYVDCEVNKDAIDGAFTIFYFLGLVSELNNDPDCCWQVEPSLAGLSHIFSARKANCSNCESQAAEGLVLTGTSPITSTLQDNIKTGKLQSLKPDDVEPFLKKNLFWRVVKPNRTTEDPAQVSGLKVSVSATFSVLRPGELMPEFKEAHYFPEVTANHHSGNPAGQ
ncbi:hypothetical protein SLS55_009757 [Diplodia seriata]|uniref:tyrosinase n=1 Tax=Diplodia seriata TaxID=420778 RepID=A0ABR3C0X5_9PEZI